VIEDAASQEEWRVGLASVTEGASNQEYWSVAVVADAVQEIKSFPVWEIEVHPDDGGWNTSLTKREC
jgi:hypothetical protein